ncbi:hypothetical protein N7532_006769 [Penicillium argentinense]|uniref:Nonsense-mediated mRNA decay factor n=1 Tax=Penicillium argentinense TaxID=1131581 RepID=A0A9W9FGJ0_9EURO|nr:uncharacterized protein N7532_006769 [Penicillium argentinense]KAJ5099768.1 hypothetical protein N7532_006769 [Penicillium argentinense]
MESHKDHDRTALSAESELTRCLAQKEPTFAEISHFLSEYVNAALSLSSRPDPANTTSYFDRFRSICQDAILLDFDTARDTDVEGRLWDAHLKVNNRFRKLLSRYRDENAKKKPVEKRKLEKHYLDFIKSSQRFYRGYIQHISSHFGGIVELEKVARKFNFESTNTLIEFNGLPVLRRPVNNTDTNHQPLPDLSAQPPIPTTPDLRKRILQSCHATLIRLGDLSRYRETELVNKDRKWGPAIGYYDLASVIYPASGTSHNQLAVIALADGNHFRATYHLYRALSTQKSHPSAKGNLEIEFKKVMSLWAKRELIRPEDAGIPGRALAPWFVYLHAQCYRGNDFPEHDELESEVMSQLAVEIRERPLEGMLQKFCLVNIAAEDFARARSNEEPVSNARLFFQRINVKTFFTLLQILLVELERFAAEDSSASSNGKDVAKNGPDKLTVVARRILPALRHYSSWLLVTNEFLVAQKEEKDSALSIQIQEFWKIYAGTLTLLTSTFDVAQLPEIDYLLEDDEESLGFLPLDQSSTSRRYIGINGQLKPRMNDPGIERSHPNMEMMYRIREFVIDGLDLVVGNKIPVALIDDEDKKTFLYREDGLPSQFFSSPHGHEQTLPTPNVEREDIPPPPAAQDANSAAEGRSMFGGSQAASASMSANMNRIVEGVERLVESDTYENAPNVPGPYAFLNEPQDIDTPPAHMGSTMNGFPFNEQTTPQLGTPIPPPGLAPPNPGAADSLRASISQSYSPLASVPGMPSIWNTASPPAPLRERTSPRTPPGLGQQPQMHSMAPPSAGLQRTPSQGQIANDLLHQSMMGHIQTPSFFDPAGPVPSSWIPPTNSSTALSRQPPGTWDGDNFNHMAYGSYSSQPMSSALPNQTWANEAFIASGFPASGGPFAPGFGSHRKSTSQLGAIGQTPPCGQGG